MVLPADGRRQPAVMASSWWASHSRSASTGQRAAEVVALGDVAAQLAQAVGDLLGLDALGDDLEAQVPREVDRRAHDRRVVVVVGHPEDERAVDLHLVQRQALEVGQRRLALAEVVERQADAEVAQPVQDLAGAARVRHDRVLGDLALQAVPGDAVALERGPGGIGQAGVDDVAGRQVDRHGEVDPGGAPARALAHGRVEHPARQVGDHARALRERYELDRRQQAARRVLPAHERLHADHAARGQRDLGLVVQDELVLVEGPAQLGQQRQALGRVGVALEVVGLDPRAGLLGLVHGDVGAAQQRRDVVAVQGAQRDADARLEVDRDAAQLERPLQGAVQAGGHLGHDAAVGDVAQQHGELVAAQAGEQVAAADDRAQAARDLDQQLVAVVVAERVVDLLEAVEVDQQERGRVALTLGGADRLLAALVQERAVGQAGQRVVQGLAAQAPRRAGHDPEQARVEDGEAQQQHDRQPRGVLGDRLGDGRVGEVGLEHALHVAPVGRAQGDVDLEQPLALDPVGVVVALGDVRDDTAGARGAEARVALRGSRRSREGCPTRRRGRASV